MAKKFFKRKEEKPKKSRKAVIDENAKKIVDNAEEKVEDIDSPKVIAEQTLKEAQDFITANSEVNKIAELSEEEKDKAVELLRAITRVLIDRGKIPDEAAGEFVKNLIQNDSKAVGVAVAEEASFIPDKQLREIINIPEVGVKDAERIVPGINDDSTRTEIQENLDLAKLEEIYETSCTEVSNDNQFVSRILKIIGSEGATRSKKINEMVDKIVARRSAFYYYEIPNAIAVTRYTKLISPVEMLDRDLPELINREYRNLKVDGPKSEFDKKICKKLIIDGVADNVVSQYIDQSPDSRVMVIPESEAIRKFNEEEENELVNQIKIKCQNNNCPLKKHQIQDIRNQIHGYKRTEEVDSLTTTLESISNPDLRREIASNFEKILDIIKEFPENEQGKITELLTTVAEKTTDKLREMKKTKQEKDKKTPPSNPGEGGR